jgi:transcriptional antiterminator NusG
MELCAQMEEMEYMMGGGEKKFTVDLKNGDMVKITDGPFKDYDGKVSQVDEKSGVIKVVIAIFGRDTVMELDSLQVQKL